MKRQILALAALFLSAATAAKAFDLPPEVQAPEYTGSIASASGWYIRGDLGYNGSFSTDNGSWRSYKGASETYTAYGFDRSRFEGDYSLSAGAGYQFNDFLRTDLTVDYFTAKFKGKSSKDSPCSQWQAAGTTCGYSHSQNLAALGILANGYIDLGTYWGITPYLGAGAGVTNMDWAKQVLSKHCINARGTCDSFVTTNDNTYAGLESWRFTYALMAGASYDVGNNTKIDFGYRYSQIAGGDMLDWSKAEQDNGATGVKAKDKGLSRHEFRVGLRLSGW